MHTHLPATAEGVVVRNVGRVEGVIILEKMDEDLIDLVSRVDGSFDLALAALNCIEEGVAEVGTVEPQLVAEQVKWMEREKNL